jgi:hypothetical protein
MNIKKTLGVVLSGAAAVAAAVAAPISAQAAPARQDCFYSSEWRGWSSPDPRTIYIRVGARDVYRIDLLGNNGRLKSGDRFLVNQVRGSSVVCTALDLNLTVSDHQGFQTPLFPRTLTKLTPEEVQAIPKQDRP